MNKVLAVVILSLSVSMVWAKGESLDPIPERQELLNGKTLVFEYTNGWGFHLTFYDNMIKYQFRQDLTNPEGIGSRNQDIPYRSRQIGSNLYQIMWHEKDVKDVITMVINLNNNTLTAAGLMSYHDKKIEVFEAASILQVIEN